MEITEEPSFTYRRRDVGEGWSHTPENLPQLIDWMAKQRLNTLTYPGGTGRRLVGWDLWREELIPELDKRDMILEVGGHGYQNFLSPEEHPEYYTSGVNVFDVDNDEAVQTYVDNVVAYVEQRPEIDIFDSWPPDGSRWPEAASEKFGSIANAYSHVTNALTEGIREERLDVTVEAIAYSSHIDPPDPEYAFDPATLIDFAPYDRSYTEPIFDDTYPRNAFYDELVQTWRQDFDGPMAFYEYYRKYSWHSLPIVLPELIGQEMAYYHSLGLNGFGIYSEPADWLTYELTQLLVAAMSWDAQLDADGYVRQYVDERYGDSAGAMTEYYAHVETAGSAIFDRAPGNYANLDVVSRARDHFLAAKDAVNRARATADDDSTEAFLADRLSTNADFAVADTEIGYYTLLGEVDEREQAKRRTKELVEAHRFDGVLLYSLWTVRRYQSDWGREPWIFAMYRGELATPLTLVSSPLMANGEPAEVTATLGNYSREGFIEN
ncbi:MAG: DUF4838 domain-containing protein, partial [Actinobacteria bacterium]|nr:DUF4838 domain-containing protein [Actinomycetota bacterium]